MLIRPTSDLHLEFLADRMHKIPKIIERFILPPMATDKETTLLISGDFGSMHYPKVYQWGMGCLAERFRHVLMIPGNHDYWGSNLRDGVVEINKYFTSYKNVVFDNFEKIPFNFLGDKRLNNIWMATLWTDYYGGNPLHMNVCHSSMGKDHEFIGGIDDPTKNSTPDDMLKVNRCMVEMMDIQPGDLVMSHHGPSFKSIHKQYERQPMENSAYASDLEPLMARTFPQYWFHGHTHHNFEYRVEETTVVCNPWGYWPNWTNKDYDPRKLIEI